MSTANCVSTDTTAYSRIGEWQTSSPTCHLRWVPKLIPGDSRPRYVLEQLWETTNVFGHVVAETWRDVPIEHPQPLEGGAGVD